MSEIFIDDKAMDRPIRVVLIHASRVIRTALGNLIDQHASFSVIAALASLDDATDFAKKTQVLFDLILIDADLVSRGVIVQLAAMNSAKIIVLSDDESAAAVESWIQDGVRGIVGPDADFEHLAKAMLKVNDGEFWLNRQVTSRILNSLSHSSKELTHEQSLIKQLTTRERLIVQAILDGHGQSLRATALTLSISENTLRNHLTSIYAKLEVCNRIELYVFAQHHLI